MSDTATLPIRRRPEYTSDQTGARQPTEEFILLLPCDPQRRGNVPPPRTVVRLRSCTHARNCVSSSPRPRSIGWILVCYNRLVSKRRRIQYSTSAPYQGDIV